MLVYRPFCWRQPRSSASAGTENATAEAGPWRIGLDFAVAGAFLAHATHRPGRETLYRQLIARAGPGTDWDNSQVIEDLRQQRFELAQALGYDDFAHMSLAKKMAGKPGCGGRTSGVLAGGRLPSSRARTR